MSAEISEVVMIVRQRHRTVLRTSKRHLVKLIIIRPEQSIQCNWLNKFINLEFTSYLFLFQLKEKVVSLKKMCSESGSRSHRGVIKNILNTSWPQNTKDT